MEVTAATASDYSLPEEDARVPKKSLDQTDFLNLLVTQMRSQDPLNPQSNEEFMSTMAQFSSLENLVSLNKNTQYAQAAGLIDKPVVVEQPNKELVAGMVEKVGLVNDEVVVYVGGNEYSFSDIREIQPQGPKVASGIDLVQAAVMVGMEVLIRDGDASLRGIVEKVGLSDGSIRVYVDGEPHEISSIAEIGAPAEEEPAGAMSGETGEEVSR